MQESFSEEDEIDESIKSESDEVDEEVSKVTKKFEK